MQTQNFRFNTHTKTIFSSSFDWSIWVSDFLCFFLRSIIMIVVVILLLWLLVDSFLFCFLSLRFYFLVFIFRKSRFTFSNVCARIFPQNNRKQMQNWGAEFFFVEKQIKLLGVDNILYIISDSHTHTCIVFVSFFDCLLRFSPGYYLVYHLEVYDILHNRFFFLLLFFFFFLVFIFLLRTFCLFFAYSNTPYVL